MLKVFKWGLAALALIVSNEVLTWAIIAVLFFAAIASFAKEAIDNA